MVFPIKQSSELFKPQSDNVKATDTDLSTKTSVDDLRPSVIIKHLIKRFVRRMKRK